MEMGLALGRRGDSFWGKTTILLSGTAPAGGVRLFALLSQRLQVHALEQYVCEVLPVGECQRTPGSGAEDRS